MEIVLMSSFCTNRRIAKSSFTPSKLRFRYLALHKNNLIIYDFTFLLVGSLAKIPITPIIPIAPKKLTAKKE